MSSVRDRILVVDDAVDTLEVIRRNLVQEGYVVFTAPGVSEAIEILNNTDLDLLITDYRMPRVDGLELIRHVRDNFKNLEVMMITGYASIAGAVEAIKAGAEEYLSKPFTEQELLTSVQKALKKRHLHQNSSDLTPVKLDNPCGLLGHSQVMMRVFGAIKKSARTNATVLITGESGTGKELIARAIHYNGRLAAGPFVPVNCGGIPEGLLESALFGHLKGAFTGATESRAGFFQTADGGTIFLDEIAELSPGMQVKLLRVLQDKQVCMVGSSRPRLVDVRIVAATNKDLPTLVSKEIFRKDLFFRLNVIHIIAPPLRDRQDDIFLLAQHFVAKYAREFEKTPPHFSDKALNQLMNYDWSGNVRELENIVQRIVVMNDEETINTSDLPDLMHYSAMRDKGLNRSLEEVEADYIKNVLASVGGNKTRAAEILKIDRKTLREKIKRFQVDPD